MAKQSNKDKANVEPVTTRRSTRSSTVTATEASSQKRTRATSTKKAADNGNTIKSMFGAQAQRNLAKKSPKVPQVAKPEGEKKFFRTKNRGQVAKTSAAAAPAKPVLKKPKVKEVQKKKRESVVFKVPLTSTRRVTRQLRQRPEAKDYCETSIVKETKKVEGQPIYKTTFEPSQEKSSEEVYEFMYDPNNEDERKKKKKRVQRQVAKKPAKKNLLKVKKQVATTKPKVAAPTEKVIDEANDKNQPEPEPPEQPDLQHDYPEMPQLSPEPPPEQPTTSRPKPKITSIETITDKSMLISTPLRKHPCTEQHDVSINRQISPIPKSSSRTDANSPWRLPPTPLAQVKAFYSRDTSPTKSPRPVRNVDDQRVEIYEPPRQQQQAIPTSPRKFGTDLSNVVNSPSPPQAVRNVTVMNVAVEVHAPPKKEQRRILGVLQPTSPSKKIVNRENNDSLGSDASMKSSPRRSVNASSSRSNVDLYEEILPAEELTSPKQTKLMRQTDVRGYFHQKSPDKPQPAKLPEEELNDAFGFDDDTEMQQENQESPVVASTPFNKERVVPRRSNFLLLSKEKKSVVKPSRISVGEVKKLVKIERPKRLKTKVLEQQPANETVNSSSETDDSFVVKKARIDTTDFSDTFDVASEIGETSVKGENTTNDSCHLFEDLPSHFKQVNCFVSI